MLCSIISEKFRLGRKSEWLCVHAMVALRHAELVHEPRQCLACLPRLQGTCLLCAVRFSVVFFFFLFFLLLFQFFAVAINIRFFRQPAFFSFLFYGRLSCVLYN